MIKRLLLLFWSIFLFISLIGKMPIRNDKKVSHAYLGNDISNIEYDSLLQKNDTAIFNEENYSSQYFKNLNTNIGNNTHGTCTYVALGMLLSFYDTYCDDGFIEEKFDISTNFTNTQNTDFEFPPFNITSPGVKFESNELVGGLTINEYYKYIDAYSDEYFHLELLHLSKEYFGTIKFDGSSNSLGMSYDEMIDFLNYYLYEYAKFSTSEVKIVSCSESKEEMKEYLKRYITSGTPVLLRTNDFNGHAFIAYDYDDKTDELYVHAGLRRESDNTALTHIPLGTLDSLQLWDVTAIEINSTHEHSNNYLSSSGKALCSCNYIFPQEIELTSGNFRDILPTFRWKSLYKEKWSKQYNPYFQLSILDTNKKELFKHKIENKKEYTLTQTEWDKLIFNSSEKSYYIYLNLYSDIYPYYDDYWTIEMFIKPQEYNELPIIKPSEYGFADAYPTDETTKTQFVEHTASNNFKFETIRYRTGYIHNEYIVMSPKRKGINEAFIEYRFQTAVTRIDVALSHWREYSSEQLNMSNGRAWIQQFVNNKWSITMNLLSDETNLPTDRNNQKYYKIIFSQPTYRIRFYSNTLFENTNDDNKGRICIGNMAFYPSEYSLPLSGYELDYEPDSWNKTFVDLYEDRSDTYVSDCTNCYSYAINAQVNPVNNLMNTMQPGMSKGHILTESEIAQVDKLVGYIVDDAKNLDFDFSFVGKNEKCSKGTYKVALFIDNEGKEYDYHWYRQNSDGTWSHKPGLSDVTNLDYDNKLIFDPQYCNRKLSDEINYNYFVGYYAIKPLNIYYN